MGNIEAKPTGDNTPTLAHFSRKFPKGSSTTLFGKNSILNRTLVIHAKEDDMSPNPSPGPKVVCGRIVTRKQIGPQPAYGMLQLWVTFFLHFEFLHKKTTTNFKPFFAITDKNPP